MTLAVETVGLSKSYGQIRAVLDVGLQVPSGCVYGFLGPNGAGKTTTVRALLGLTRFDRGEIRLLGRDIRRHRREALKSVGALIEHPSLYDHLTGEQNLDLTRRMLSLPRSEVARVLEIVNMTAAKSVRVAQYSLGMRQRLGIARAIIGDPKLLLLDEPTNGLDPEGIIDMRRLIRELPGRIGGTVFVSSHLLSEIEQIAGVVGLMRKGRLLLQDRLATLLDGPSALKIRVDDLQGALGVLADSGDRIRHAEGDLVIVELAPGVDISMAGAEANRRLVQAGIGVYGFSRDERTLEQVYREHAAESGDAP